MPLYKLTYVQTDLNTDADLGGLADQVLSANQDYLSPTIIAHESRGGYGFGCMYLQHARDRLRVLTLYSESSCGIILALRVLPIDFSTERPFLPSLFSNPSEGKAEPYVPVSA